MAININTASKNEDMTLKKFENYVNSSEFEEQLETAINESTDDSYNYRITIYHESVAQLDSSWGGELSVFGVDKRKWKVFEDNVEEFRAQHKKDLSLFKPIFENAIKEINSKGGTKRYKYTMTCKLIDEEHFGKTTKNTADNTASITYQLFVSASLITNS